MTETSKAIQIEDQIVESDLTAASLMSVKISSMIGLIGCVVFAGVMAIDIEYPVWMFFALIAIILVSFMATFGFGASKVMDVDEEHADEWQSQMAQYARSIAYQGFQGALILGILAVLVLDFFKINVSVSIEADDVSLFLMTIAGTLFFSTRIALADKIIPLDEDEPNSRGKVVIAALTGQNWKSATKFIIILAVAMSLGIAGGMLYSEFSG